MTCYHPIKAYQSKFFKENGKRSIIFSPSSNYDPIPLPCGQCSGCRLERSRQWAIRCTHEASLYSDNCFITLTFNDDSLYRRSNPWSLDVDEFQKFMKRFRKRCDGITAVDGLDKDGNHKLIYPIRYYHAGEYGSCCKTCNVPEEEHDISSDACSRYLLGRPHYHACIFNYDFADKQPYKMHNGNMLYTSELLQSLWPFGFSTVASFSFQTAAYVARYIMKKRNGDLKFDRYTEVDFDTGEILADLKPEYPTMSRNPGIASRWFDQFKDDVYPDDFVVLNGKKMRPPKFYDYKLEKLDPYDLDLIKAERIKNAEKHIDNNTDERLKVREQCKLAAIKRLKRNLSREYQS